MLVPGQKFLGFPEGLLKEPGRPAAITVSVSFTFAGFRLTRRMSDV